MAPSGQAAGVESSQVQNDAKQFGGKGEGGAFVAGKSAAWAGVTSVSDAERTRPSLFIAAPCTGIGSSRVAPWAGPFALVAKRAFVPRFLWNPPRF
jgi:hypothetical protein